MIKKSTFVFFLLAASLLRIDAQKKVAPPWPGVPYTSVRVFLYNLDNQLYGQYQAWKNGIPNFTLVQPGTGLNPEQIKQLETVLNSDTRVLNEGLSKCYEPHHAVFFYDEKDKIVAAFDVCFLCEGIRFYPSKKYKSELKSFSDAQVRTAQQQLEQLKTVFTEAGVPVFKKQEEASEYAQKNLVKSDTLVVISDSVFSPFVHGYKNFSELKNSLHGLNHSVDSSYKYRQGDHRLNFIEYYNITGANIRMNCSRQQVYGLIHVNDFMIKIRNNFLPASLNIGQTRTELNRALDSAIPGYAHHTCIQFNSSDGRRTLLIHFNEKKNIDHVTYYDRP